MQVQHSCSHGRRLSKNSLDPYTIDERCFRSENKLKNYSINMEYILEQY